MRPCIPLAVSDDGGAAGHEEIENAATAAAPARSPAAEIEHLLRNRAVEV